MTLGEMTTMLDRVQQADRETPGQFKPLVAIGHTKDLVDIAPIDAFLSLLEVRGIAVSSLEGVHARCLT